MKNALIVLAFIAPNAFGALPDVSKITEIQDFVSNGLSIGDIGNAASNVGGMVFQGANGETAPTDFGFDDGLLGDLTSAAGGIAEEFSQREPWTLSDEYMYSITKDYGDLPKLMECMEYALVGSCLSVRWTMFGPKFTFGFAVEHFVRDVHVEVLPQAPVEDILEVPEDTVLPSSVSTVEDIAMMYPYTWKIARQLGSGLLTNSINSLLEDAEGQTVDTPRTRYLYSDVQVSGNIERHMFDMIGGAFIGMFGYCNSPTMPGLVYYNSTLDQFSWRWLATSEVILTALYQIRYLEWNDIGRSYGSTFPRTGYIESNNRFKTSVIAAIRGTSISAENRGLFSGIAGLHIYTPLPEFASSSFTESNYKTPQDAKSFKLEMIYPFEGERCTRYGTDDMLGSLSITGQLADDQLTTKFGKKNPNNTAMFKLLRPFRCCRKNGNKVFSFVSPGPIGLPK
ncbi:hypothetical protein [Enterovibrio norvegicus]|uniref:hypothetical protein n=1 Tax=Enterovibrio norvegicus TaxID=188144 RepID=UPI000C840304|nr:hypothetical protein [Enterovibrio norvegicus]PMH64425.1 hypothetical protein BCU62_15330 [Enterovibrio norvegicus]